MLHRKSHRCPADNSAPVIARVSLPQASQVGRRAPGPDLPTGFRMRAGAFAVTELEHPGHGTDAFAVVPAVELPTDHRQPDLMAAR